MTKINEEIFRTYDIRGIYPEELNEETAYAIARATVRFLGAKKMAIGHDTRLSSPKLFQAVIKGIVDEGATAYAFGLAGIEMIYFVCGYYKMDGGIMITASHNAKEYNGMKLIREKAISLTTGTGIDKVKAITLKEPWTSEKAKRKGKIKRISPWRDYKKYIDKVIDLKSLEPLKVVIDPENGMFGMMIEAVLKESKIKLTKLNFTPNGNFPKHDPNPMIKENRQEAKNKLKSLRADVAFIADGDADRICVLDEKGKLLMTDYVGALIAEKLLKEKKDKGIVWTAVKGWSLRDTAKQGGSRFYQTRQGYPFVKLKMRAINAMFGGEPSGHYFYKDFFISDSGVLTTLNIIDLIGKEKKPLSEIVAKLRENYFMIEEQNFLINNVEKLLALLEKTYTARGGKVSHLDCLSLDFPEWHFNFRPSNNPEPVYRLNVEAKSEAILKKEIESLTKIVLKYGERVN